MLDVLDTDVHALLDVSVSDNLVDDNTDSVWCHVVHNTSSPKITIRIFVNNFEITFAPMVVFVGHTLLLGSVCFDIDDISNPEVDEIRRHLDWAMVWDIMSILIG